MIAKFIRPELNRSETSINDQIRARVHPLLLEVCNDTYNKIAKAGLRLDSFKEHFDSLPRAVCECSAREQLLPESDLGLLRSRLHSLESDTQSLILSLEQRQQDCASLQRQVRDIKSSQSWKVTAPLRALGNFVRLTGRRSIF